MSKKKIENPLQYPVQSPDLYVRAGIDSVRDRERVDERVTPPPDGTVLHCSVCFRKIAPRSIRPGRLLCPRCRPDAIYPVVVYRGTEPPLKPLTPAEREALKIADAERAAIIAKPLTPAAVQRPHEQPCSKCGKATHAEGLCAPAQAYANQDEAKTSGTPTHIGRATPARGRRLAHGSRGTPGLRWPYDDATHRRWERNVRRVAEAAARRKKAREARRAAEARAAAWADATRPDGVTERAWEALRLVEVEGLGLPEAGRRLGGIRKAAVSRLAQRAREARDGAATGKGES